MLKLLRTLPLVLLVLLTGCVENDIPYLVVRSNITAFEVEGLCNAPGGGSGMVIDKAERKVLVYVADTVDVKRLQITRFSTDETDPLPTITVLDSARCINYRNFPRKPFASLADCYVSANTRVDFSDESQPVRFRLTTYQDYDWAVSVRQVIERDLRFENQVGEAIIDETNHNVIMYVTPETKLRRVKVKSFTLGGEHGRVVPDPSDTTAYPDGFDFSREVKFNVCRGWEEVGTEWAVHVYHREASAAKGTVFPMTLRARISGTMKAGKSIGVEYRPTGAEGWTAVDEADIESNGLTFSTTIQGLSPETEYEYRLLTDGEPGETEAFTTAPATPLTDGDFDNWCVIKETGHSKDTYCPWPEGGTSFWDTGNHGATTVGPSNSLPTNETCNGHGQAAYLESKYIVIKFAAGNIFTGTYKQTDGTNGILDFGRPFSGFPSKMRVHYKCQPATINKCGNDDYRYLVGQPDTCQIYIALTDWEEPFEIRTRPSNLSLFDKNDSHVIAYAEIKKGEAVDHWTQEELVLQYRHTDRTPRYIVVVASSSMFGDFFTGGDGSKLWVDNFELIYE